MRTLRRLLAITAVMSSLAGAAGCSGGNLGSVDGGTDGPAGAETGVDASTDGSPAHDGAADAVGQDARGDAAGDASGDSAVPGEGGTDGGSTGTFPGESAPPYTSSNCTLWGSSPPLLSFGQYALAVGSEGVWAGAANQPFVMRLSGGVWYLSTLPGVASGTGVQTIVAGTGWAVAQAGAGTYYHSSGKPWVSIPYRAYLYAADTELLGFDPSGVYWFDGAAWNTIPNPVGSTGPGAAAGPHDNLYILDNLGLHHYDGTTWTDIVSPSTALAQLALPTGGPLVAATSTAASSLFVYSGGTWTNVTPLPCSFGYLRRSGPASDVLLQCDDSTGEIVQFTPGANTFTVRAQTQTFILNAVALSGSTLYLLEGTSSLSLLSSTGGLATPVLTSKAPSYLSTTCCGQPFAGRSPTELYAAQDLGIMALSGGTWSQLPGTGSIPVSAMWESPEGTLFFAQQTSNATTATFAMHRFTAGAVTTDGTVSGTNPAGHNWSNLIGRSASDAYFAIDYGVQHWDGTSWSDTGFNQGYEITILGVGTAPDLFVYGTNQLTYQTFLWNGSSAFTASTTAFSPGSSGTTPLVFQWLAPSTVQYDQGAGWLSIPTPVPNACTTCGPTGPDPSHVVLFDKGTFTYSKGATWSTYSDALTQLITTTSVAWTDGTQAAVAAPNGVVLCTLP
jgi:hypothetical protein